MLCTVWQEILGGQQLDLRLRSSVTGCFHLSHLSEADCLYKGPEKSLDDCFCHVQLLGFPLLELVKIQMRHTAEGKLL